MWNARKAWFKKPLGFLQTPFQWTLWLDLDCEVLDSLNPLFEDPTTQLAMVKEPSSSLEAQYKLNLLTPGTLVYNSGVLFYPHGYPLLTHLAQVAESQSKFFMGDQDLLANLLHAKPNCVKELSNIYNWRIAEGFNPEAIIIHWVGVFGKNQLKMRLRS